MSAKLDWRKAKLKDLINQQDDVLYIDGHHRKLARRKALARNRAKTAKADAAKANKRERYAAEMAAFEQRQRYTLIKGEKK
jgi:hypothetical protein